MLHNVSQRQITAIRILCAAIGMFLSSHWYLDVHPDLDTLNQHFETPRCSFQWLILGMIILFLQMIHIAKNLVTNRLLKMCDVIIKIRIKLLLCLCFFNVYKKDEITLWQVSKAVLLHLHIFKIIKVYRSGFQYYELSKL